MTQPINLMERFGERYRIGFDPSYDAKHRPKDKLDPWMMEIPCQRGTIYPDDDRNLCVMIDHRPVTAKRVAKIPGVELVQDGDHEKTFRFPVALFDQVAELVKPRRRRQISDSEKERLRELSAKHGFKPQKHLSEHSRDTSTGV